MDLRPHPVTLRKLQYVLAVEEHRSFRKAARACAVSQPALSAQVAEIEQALGVTLFERDRRSVRPTAAGEELVALARDVLARADVLVTAARRLGDPLGGTIRVGLIPTVAPYLLPVVAPEVRRRFPKLVVAWTEDKTQRLLERLREGDVDAAVVALDADVARLPHVVLGRDPFLLAVPPGHQLAREDGIVAESALAGESVLLLDDGHCFRDQALAACARGGAAEAGFRGTSLATLVQMAAGGLGVTLLPRIAVDVENRGSTLHLRPFRDGGPARDLVLTWRSGVALEPTSVPLAAAMSDAWARVLTV